ncbi:flippase-like domain-containing protein [Capillimicrobium parvum]|uniref:Uncharacterized protein n=1 Tax=Capillimicrobium parvum TaxID=2884022 RepID=A0A9E6XXC2_9ACTN|nr:flippase-like domain-containing protein [Capillimicrobium parvum]UGS36219.1 hypothetical protein DSM104329_02619 [Capillimicrobium parvum]
MPGSVSARRGRRRSSAPPTQLGAPGRSERLHRHRLPLSVIAVMIAAGALIGVATVAGWHNVVRDAWPIHPGWIALGVAGQVLALAGYTAAFRSVTAAGGCEPLPTRDAADVVTAGFGAFALGGGFAVDRRALDEAGYDSRDSTVRVLGLGALEYAVLAPATCVAAIALLLEGSSAQRAMLWSWAIGVPAGLAIGLWASAPDRRLRVRDGGRLRRALCHALDGVGMLHELVRHPIRYAAAWWGMTLYWAADIATLYAALRLFGVHLGAAETIVAYSTGYAATRRTLPLAGVGATEVLLALSLTWVGVGLATAVPVVAAYRLANVALLLVPALHAHGRLGRHRRRGPPPALPKPTAR